MGRLCRYCSTVTALLLVYLAVVPQRVNCSSIFELDLVSLENFDGREISGGCCSGLPGSDGSCPGNCSVYLHFCIRHYQVMVDMNSPCTFFEFQTPLLNLQNSTRGAYNVLAQERMSHYLTFAWPGEFSLVVEAWHPSDGKGSSKNLVDRFVAQRILPVNSEWTNDTLLTSRSSVGIKYRVICDTNYYGPECRVLCRARDDKFGHYSCSRLGEIMCLPGWGNIVNDSYCLLPLCNPECKFGHCNKSKEPHFCTCFAHWTGPACDKCITPDWCKHGKCEAKRLCLCDEGWGGLLCNDDLNYCTNHKPCQHGGTCTNTGLGSYTCTCPDDFMGVTCEVYKDPCKMNPCENGATCKNPNAGQYICECAPSYFGRHCDTWANICNDNKCINGGTCIQDPEGFACACPLGYTGIFCEEINSSNCQVYPCFNGGTCINSSDGFHCICPQGITGNRCETIVHCSSDSCENGGTCVGQSENITCVCPSGYSGPLCQINHNRCSSNPCANGATCYNLIDNDNGYRCVCAPGFIGQYCNLRDHCRSSPCLNGASCHVTANGYLCHCLSGYRGQQCHLVDTVVTKNWNGQPSAASNVSHRISKEEDDTLNKADFILICSLSTSLLFIIILISCVVRCMVRRRLSHQQHVEESPPKTKDYDFDAEEERLQNERNAMHMNNKQCDMPRKIVNELERVPAKLTNEAPPKVLNKEVGNKRIPDKSLVCSPRTFQKIDNTSGSSISCHSSRACSPCSSGGIYVIEDHLRSQCDSSSSHRKKDMLATEV